MTGKLEGKVAVVTGGSAGIGLAAAKRFAEEGAYVFITGRRQPELDAAVKEIGPKAVAVRADSSDIADLAHLFDKVKAATSPSNSTATEASSSTWRGTSTRRHFTVTVIIGDMTGGLNGTCDQSANSSCSLCWPGGSVNMVSVCPPPKCMCLASITIGYFNSSGERVVSISRWWWPVFGLSTPAGAMPTPVSPNCTLNGLVTVSPSFKLMI
jgi:hypothetical protein